MLEVIDMSHGAGGKKFEDLFRTSYLPAFNNIFLNQITDGALLGELKGRLVMSTDSHVVTPLFFDGGDIGTLAFCGTVNDLAMMGAIPKYLTLGFIIEEGFLQNDLIKIINSISKLSREFGIPIVSGDTKVVEKGKCDGIYITTAGIGSIENEKVNLHPQNVTPGSQIIVSGNIGNHGMAILSKREGLSFESSIHSDCAPINQQVISLLEEFPEIQCLRDPTRGGLAAVFNEISNACGHSLLINEAKIPVLPEVHSASELLGLDPLNLACEGRFVLFSPAEHTEQILKKLKTLPHCENSSLIGEVKASLTPIVEAKTTIGGRRIITWPSGEQLPRIC